MNNLRQFPRQQKKELSFVIWCHFIYSNRPQKQAHNYQWLNVSRYNHSPPLGSWRFDSDSPMGDKVVPVSRMRVRDHTPPYSSTSSCLLTASQLMSLWHDVPFSPVKSHLFISAEVAETAWKLSFPAMAWVRCHVTSVTGKGPVGGWPCILSNNTLDMDG